MKNRNTLIALIVTIVASPAFAAPAAPATQPRPTATTGEYDAHFGPTTITIPSGGVLMLDGRRATEKASFLGVSVTKVSAELREQLKLRPGIGLLVNHVEAASPAEAAGIKRFDVLERLDDQLLIEARQLSVLIRLRKAGDEVKLTLIRAAQPVTVTAKLAEKDLPALDDVLIPTPGWRTIPLPRGSGMIGGPLDPFAPAKFDIAWSDGELSLDMLHDHGRRLVARNKAGDVIFEGAIDTPDELQRIPEIVKSKAMRLIRLASTQPLTHPTTQSSREAATQPLQFRSTLKPFKIAPPRSPSASPAADPVPSPAM